MHIIDYQKYRDMAYLNDAGRAWLRTVYQKDIWNEWETLVACMTPKETIKKLTRGNPDAEWLPSGSAKRIFIEAIWYLGFEGVLLEDKSRYDSELRAKQSKSQKGYIKGGTQEIMYLDQWLELRVRPRVPR